MKGIKVIGVGSKPEETEFGMYETCFGYGVVNNPYMILEFPDGSQVAQETYYWDFEDYVEIVVDNVTDFSAWLSEQELQDRYVEALKNDNKYTLIGLINEYNWQLEETDE